MRLEALLDWLAALPPAALLPAMAVLAAVENIFPPIPADLLVAFGGFLAARNHGTPIPAFLAVWLGSVTGALFMFAVGRRMGREWIARRFHLAPGGANEKRLTDWYVRFGTLGLFISRFLPAFRALVPPMAGALRLSLPRVAVAISLASGLWYGLITWLAFSAGSNWETLASKVARLGVWSGVIALIVVVAAVLAWWWRRRRATG
ncbi:MAG: DedA family protein [Gemmatimonadetes bacterium]|nr:DedA family protein [Gemmatimonadota bacterium]MCC6769892.1 DedA family protein [Gemmatimonadaceae bacterium]